METVGRFERKVPASERNLLEKYGIPYSESENGLGVVFTERQKQDDPGFFYYVMSPVVANAEIRYNDHSSSLRAFLLESSNGLHPGDIVQECKSAFPGFPPKAIPYVILYIEPDGGWAWGKCEEWITVRGPRGIYDHPATHYEPYNRGAQLHEGHMALLSLSVGHMEKSERRFSGK